MRTIGRRVAMMVGILVLALSSSTWAQDVKFGTSSG
jgi:hypothetical protein